jgi:hypothetical protein
MHRNLGLESRAPHTPLATDANSKRFHLCVYSLRSPLRLLPGAIFGIDAGCG